MDMSEAARLLLSSEYRVNEKIWHTRDESITKLSASQYLQPAGLRKLADCFASHDSFALPDHAGPCPPPLPMAELVLRTAAAR